MTPEGVAAAGPVETARRSFAFYRAVTLASLIIGYIGYYLCRANLPAAKESLNTELGIDTKTFGDIVSLGNAIYAAGKFAGGAATEAVGGRRIFFIGLFGSVLATVGFGATGGAIALFIFWGLNRAFQSVGWGGLMSVLSRWFTPSQYGSASGMLSVSYQFGGVVATLFAGVLLKYGAGWRMLFFGPAIVLGVLGFILLGTIKASPTDVGFPLPTEAEAKQESEEPLSLGARLQMLLLNGPFLIVCALSLVLTLLRETFTYWLPAFFAQVGGGSYVAVFKSALFPLLGCVGTIFAGWLSDRYFRHNRGPILAVFLAGAGVVLYALGHPQITAGLGFDKGLMAAILVGAAGFFILAPYSMVGGGVFALDHGGRQAAGTAAGLLDGVGYTASILAGTGVANLLTSGSGDFGPVFTLMAWAVFATAGLSVVLTVIQRKRAHG